MIIITNFDRLQTDTLQKISALNSRIISCLKSQLHTYNGDARAQATRDVRQLKNMLIEQNTHINKILLRRGIESPSQN